EALCGYLALGRQIGVALDATQSGTAAFGRLLRQSTACSASAVGLARVLRLTVQANVSKRSHGQMSAGGIPDDPLLPGVAGNVVPMKRPRKKQRDDPPPL